MLHYVTDATNGIKVAINPEYVIAVFIAPDGPMIGKTCINLNGGTIIVEEIDIDLVNLFNGVK